MLKFFPKELLSDIILNKYLKLIISLNYFFFIHHLSEYYNWKKVIEKILVIKSSQKGKKIFLFWLSDNLQFT
jgi:hypothetical protein